MAERTAEIRRDTNETKIRIALDLDGSGRAEIGTGVGFFDHMLEQVARHGLVDLTVEAAGDLAVDAHHTVEDVGIVLGQAVDAALGERRGIARYGHAYVPLDEALSRVVLDFSGRPGLVFAAAFPRPRVGEFDVELVREFFQGFVNHAQCTLHVDNLRGDNVHHIIETLFKAFGRALRAAAGVDERLGGATPSTKGRL
ncbi:MAG: imidazoleglycerol-phosphate dehydratase HisB [Halofilum sp. (in: g-proteobacteria)]|nr:imidazoleglycerol-phosphate dehydratase HisB [Halofilum sp. (in: g-proteobacteria)]